MRVVRASIQDGGEQKDFFCFFVGDIFSVFSQLPPGTWQKDSVF